MMSVHCLADILRLRMEHQQPSQDWHICNLDNGQRNIHNIYYFANEMTIASWSIESLSPSSLPLPASSCL